MASPSPAPLGLSPDWAAPPVQGGAAGVVPSFRERAPWLGGDLQTLRNVVRGTPPDLPGGERLLLPVSGGERLAARLDRQAGSNARPLIVLVHGLAGSETSRSVVASTRHLVGHGWPVLRLNLRGTLPSLPTAAGHYHAGRTEDLAEALRGLPAELIRFGIILFGHSLGGNLMLKFMGEGGHGLPVLGAVAVSTPIDLAATCARMMATRNFAYHRYMLDAMKREALAPGAAVSTAERAAIAAAGNIGDGFRPGDHRQKTQQQHLRERVSYLPALPEIRQVFEIA